MHNNNESLAERSVPKKIRKRATVLTVALLLLPLGCAPRPVVVPYLGTPDAVAQAMLKLAHVGPEDVVYDLGSGDGRIVIMAAREFGARGVGVEIDARLVAKARTSAQKAGVADRVTFIEGDIFRTDVRPASVVVLYLGDEFNRRLRPKLRADLKPSARVVSHQFRMGDWPPDAERRVDENMLYLWRIP